ncbi:MAG: bifunctional folylpolyglutamate synthase/dihydrofolate synthase [Bacteroidia bacterium]|nr:bifunctional folylpolyglutamate synthase/dihydrofolate synthase [Bacteroidia bacterium]
MNYTETLDFLYNQLPAYHRIGKAAYKNNLDNTLALDSYFEHPHRKFKTIHIAGTNGKGSVSHMVASVLQEAGWVTGLYTSPHLKDFRERIRVNGRMIPKQDVTSFVKKHHEIIDSLKPSFFEMTVAMAFDHFARKKVDVAVIEVGLGGRLDSTNIINPVLSVITNIGHDHMDLLGDSIGKVAFEKAGIIKTNVPVIVGETQQDTSRIFISKAEETESPLFFADGNFRCMLRDWEASPGKRKYTLNDLKNNRSINGTIPLGGDYQQRNLQTVYQIFKILQDDFTITEKYIKDGISRVIKNTGLLGRWQIIGRDPLTICDTGHNKEGLEYVLAQIKKIPATDLHIVIGFVSDKDISSILPMFPVNAHYYFTRARVLRALDENILRTKATAYRLEGESYPDVKTALETARANALPADLVFVGGSNFIVAEVI